MTECETMTEINELESEELAAAVAEAQGWERHRHNSNSYWWWRTVDGWLVMEVVDYHPDHNISQAYGLLDGYVYAINNYGRHEDQGDDPVSCYLRRGSIASWACGPDACVAICRAYLKAMAR